MVQAELTIANAQGIHLGPANRIANLADRFDSKIHFKTEYMDVNAKSIINLISGTFHQGDKVTCVCEGPDEREALKAMERILSGDLEEKEE
ncbi:MAG: HPr family phosphocarrier protein [Eubacteriales bacterium]|nr:HPr family phosphocarrier protein [Eubacteriales bacterium]